MVTEEDQNGDCNAQKLINDEIIERDNHIKYIEKKAYSHIVLHIVFQCCKQRFEAISSSIEWGGCFYVQFSLFACVRNQRQRHISVYQLAEILTI